MKTAYLFIVLSSFLWNSCIGNNPRQSLQDIESYIQERPDCALEALTSIPANELGCASLRARHALLYSMALDKNYIDISNDSIIRSAVDYYSTRRDKDRSMMAWYYLGRVQLNGGHYGDAAVSFSKAGQLTDNPFWKGLIYRNLGDLYSHSYDIQTAADYYRLSRQCFTEANEPRYAVYSSFNLARIQYVIGNKELADSIWCSLQEYALEKDSYLYSQMLLAEASQELTLPLPTPDDVILRIETGYRISREPFRCKDLGNLAYAYALKGKTDSAYFYYQTALSKANSVQDSATLYALRYQIEDCFEHYPLANEYLEKAMAIQNELMNRRENMVISNSLERNAREEQMAVQTKAKQRIRFLVITLLGFGLAVILLIWRIRIHRRTIQAQRSQIEEEMIRTEEILDQLERIKDENDEVRKQIRTTILDQVSMIKRWSDAYYGMNAPEKALKKDPGRQFDEDYIPDSVKKEEIMRRFCTSLKVLRTDDTLFRHLEESVNQWKGNLMSRVRKACFEPGKKKQTMDESDFKTLTLMFAEIPDKTIAYLLNLSYGAVRMRRSRYKAYFERTNDEDAVCFLKELTKTL